MVSFTGYSVTNETSTVFPDLSVRDERMRESGDGSDSTMTFTVRATLVGGDGPRLDAGRGRALGADDVGARVVVQRQHGRGDGRRLAAHPRARRLVAAGARRGRGREGRDGDPRLALGLRHDGGDAETGYGVDIAGGVDLALPGHGLTASLSAGAC